MSLQTEVEMPTEVGAKQKKPKDLTCINCRKWHTKCDRKKPTCTLCIERNIPCVYAKGPKKRGPRGGKVPVLDDIKKMEDEIERYKQMAAFYEQKTQIMEQQYNQLFSDGFLTVEPRGLFKLSNSMLFNTLIDIYMWGGYPSYEIKPPFTTIEELDASKIYTPQKALMYSILASASAYTGDVKLYKQLEQEAKAAMGPLFDNSNCADIVQSHFMIAEAQMSMGDCERAIFFVDIARRSTDNFISKYSAMPQAQHLKKVSDFTYACLLAWAGYIDQALIFINEFFYSSNNSSLSGEEPNYVYQLNILQLKIALEAALYIQDNRSANVKQYNTWITLAEQGDELLKQTEKFPERMRKILQVYQEASKALIYFVGNQPQFMLECVKGVLETARQPICVCSYWSATIVAVISGLCMIYDWQEEFELSLRILEESSYKHPTSALLNKGVKETISKYGKTVSYRDFVRSVKGYVDHTAPLFNRDVCRDSSIVEIINSTSVSSPESVDNHSQISDPNMEMEQQNLSPDMIFHEDEANAFIEQIMSNAEPHLLEGVVNPFIFPEDEQSIDYSVL